MDMRRLMAGAALVAAILLAGLSGPRPAAAKMAYSAQTGLPCARCHIPGQESRGQFGLTVTGGAFLQCGLKPECVTGKPPAAPAAAAPAPAPAPAAAAAAQPAPAPAPAPVAAPAPVPAPPEHATSEDYDGVANFGYGCTGGQLEWIALRPGENNPARTFDIVLEPDRKVKLRVPVGTTYAANCGAAPDQGAQFQYVDLSEWSTPK